MLIEEPVRRLAEHGNLKCWLRVNTSDELVWKENILQAQVSKHLTVEAGQNWLDIGGYIGTFALYLLDKGANVYSVEAWKPHAELYKENLLLNGYQPVIHEAAVLSAPPQKELILHTAARRKGYKNFGANSLFNRWKSEHPTVTVPASSFVSIVDICRQATRDHWNLKLDIEGAEIEILERDDLSLFDQIFFEYHYQVDDSVERASMIMERLTALGFMLKLSRPLREPKHWMDMTFLVWAKRT